MRIRSANKALNLVVSLGIEGSSKRYRTRGGGHGYRWKTTGITKDQVGVDGRVVLEALSYRARPDIIIRVYSEEPLETHYARRATSPEAVQACISEAAVIFGNIPGEPPTSLGLLGKIINILFRGALNPIPPPFDIDKIEM